MREATRKIVGFQSLADGWHYGGGLAPSQGLVGRAIGMSNLLDSMGFTDTDAFPGADGEIMLAAYRERHCVEITLETDRTFRFSHQEGDVELVYKERLSIISLLQLLNSALRKVTVSTCLTFDSFTQPL